MTACPRCDLENTSAEEAFALGVGVGIAMSIGRPPSVAMHVVTEMMCAKHRASHVLSMLNASSRLERLNREEKPNA